MNAPDSICRRCIWRKNDVEGLYMCPYHRCTQELASSWIEGGRIFELYVDRITGEKTLLITRRVVMADGKG